MKKILLRTVAVLAAVAVFAGLVFIVLKIAHVSEPTATTIHGSTPRRLWATASAALALISVGAGLLALTRPAGRFGTRAGKRLPILGGLIASTGGGLVLAFAEAGPGSGNGVVGGAAALVLGLFAITLGLVASLRRSDR